MRFATVVRKGLRTGLLCGALVLPKAGAGAQRVEASRVAVVAVAASLPLVAAQPTDSVAKNSSNRRAHILIGAGIGAAVGGVFMGGIPGTAAGNLGHFAGGALQGALWGGLIGALLPHR